MSSWGSFGNSLPSVPFNSSGNNNNQIGLHGGNGSNWGGFGGGQASNGITPGPFGQYSSFMQEEANRPGGGGLSLGEQVQGAGMSDYQNLVGATDDNWNRTNDANNAYRDTITGGADQISQSGEDARNRLNEFADGSRAFGAEQGKTITDAYDVMKDEYSDTSAMTASSMAAGMRRQAASQDQMLEAGIAQGDPNALAQRSRNRQEADHAAAGMAAQQASAYNQGLMQVNQFGVQAAGQAAGIRMNSEQMATGLNQMGVSLAAQAEANAAQFAAQGMGNYASMIANNPYNPVAFLPTLMSFFQFQQTPGSRSSRGFDSGFYGDPGYGQMQTQSAIA
tara:strand:- start:118 stop:1125 length:1008 start_codon:yes stop_codon:yes gene_type:complete